MASMVSALTPSRRHGAARTDNTKTVATLRTNKMYEEADDFATRMSEFERGLQTFQHATTDFIESLMPMMTATLPRVWDQLPEGGLAEPLRATLSHSYPTETLGANADVNGIRSALLEMERKLVMGISRPLGQWREALNTARGRLPEVERLRKELQKEQSFLDRSVSKAESRHRRRVGLEEEPHGVAGLLFRCTHPRTSSPSRYRPGAGQVASESGGEDVGAGGVPGAAAAAAGARSGGGRFQDEFRSEDRNMKTVYRARRREAVLKSFTEQEALLNEQLSGLCRDASWLKSYMVASLVASKEGMQSSVHYLGDTKQPVPGYPLAHRMQTGAVADNSEPIRAVPKFLSDRATRMQSLERMRLRMGESGIHAHRAVASPLELHARGDMSGRETVPPARQGAQGLPLGDATRGLLTGTEGPVEGTMAPAGTTEAEVGLGPTHGSPLGGAAAMTPSAAAPPKLAVMGDTILPVSERSALTGTV